MIDDPFDLAEYVPLWSIVGAFPVDAHGAIIDNFRPNEWYRPSPKTLGLPEPDNELEHVLQLVHAQYRSVSDLASAALDASLYIYAFSRAQESVIGLYTPDGSVCVPAYTSTSQVPNHWPEARSIQGRDLVDLLAGHSIVINPDDVVRTILPAEELQDALGRTP